MRSPYILAAVLVATSISGCSLVVSVRPLYNSTELEKPYLEPRLEGEWRMPVVDRDDDTFGTTEPWAFINIVRPKGPYSSYEMTARWKESPTATKEKTMKYNVRLVPLDGNLFFDAEFASARDEDKQLNSSDALTMTASPGHLLGQTWIQPDFVRVSILNSEWIGKSWPKESLETSSIDKYSDILTLLNPTSSLREELARYAKSEDLFRFAFYLCREGTDCARVAVEDQLARTPDDKEALENAIELNVVRGNFSKAIALQRREIEVQASSNEKEATNRQLYLARLLLCNKEYESGRSLLRQIKGQSDFGRSPQLEMLVQSYFLEGKYDKAVEVAMEIKQDDQKSGDAIALAYFALYRLGRGKEAENFLREETNQFKGPANEQLLLLNLAGRLTSSPFSKDPDLERYYSALLAIRNGKLEDARWFLKEQIVQERKPELKRIAAQIELDRLGQPSAK